MYSVYWKGINVSEGFDLTTYRQAYTFLRDYCKREGIHESSLTIKEL